MGSVAGPEKVKKPLAPERLEEALVPLSLVDSDPLEYNSSRIPVGINYIEYI